MRKVIWLAYVAILSVAPLAVPCNPVSAQTVTALRTGERTTNTKKECLYSFGGREYTRSVGANEVCPASIQVRLGEARASQRLRRLRP